MQREEYVGPWLPEPVPTGAVMTGEELVARQESITLAFLVLLETLSPAERAAVLLREVFDRDYDEVADTLDTTPAAARQLVHRAKSRIAEGRPPFTASPEGQREIVATFFAAVQKGDLTGLERYLAADVTYSADGGGKGRCGAQAGSRGRERRTADARPRAQSRGGHRRHARGMDYGSWRHERRDCAARVPPRQPGHRARVLD